MGVLYVKKSKKTYEQLYNFSSKQIKVDRKEKRTFISSVKRK